MFGATDAGALRSLDATAPRLALRAQRLALFTRIDVGSLHYITVPLFAARNSNRSWLSTIENDLKWLATSDDLYTTNTAFTVAQWCAVIRAGPKSSVKAVRRICREKTEVQLSAPSVTPAIPSGTADLGNVIRDCDTHVCEVCGKVQRSQQTLELNMLRQHKARQALVQYIDCTICPRCRIQFHTRIRLLDHMCEKGQCVISGTSRITNALFPKISINACDCLRRRREHDPCCCKSVYC